MQVKIFTVIQALRSMDETLMCYLPLIMFDKVDLRSYQLVG